MRDLDWACSTIIWNHIVWDHVFYYCYRHFGLSHNLLWIGHGHIRTKSHRHVHWMIIHALHACPQESKSYNWLHKILIVQDWIKKCLIQLAIVNHTILYLHILESDSLRCINHQYSWWNFSFLLSDHTDRPNDCINN